MQSRGDTQMGTGFIYSSNRLALSRGSYESNIGVGDGTLAWGGSWPRRSLSISQSKNENR